LETSLVRSLVEDYISNDRTIILATISAENGYANQVILERARDVDPRGSISVSSNMSFAQWLIHQNPSPRVSSTSSCPNPLQTATVTTHQISHSLE